MPLRNILTRSMSATLWGDRPRWGLTPDINDPCWQKWQTAYSDFYQANQREGIPLLAPNLVIRLCYRKPAG